MRKFSYLLEIDGKNGLVHVLDLDERGCITVTNGIEEIYTKEVNEKPWLEKMDWILYHTDGFITEFIRGKHIVDTFRHIPALDFRVKSDWAKIMERRLERN